MFDAPPALVYTQGMSILCVIASGAWAFVLLGLFLIDGVEVHRAVGFFLIFLLCLGAGMCAAKDTICGTCAESAEPSESEHD